MKAMEELKDPLHFVDTYPGGNNAENNTLSPTMQRLMKIRNLGV